MCAMALLRVLAMCMSSHSEQPQFSPGASMSSCMEIRCREVGTSNLFLLRSWDSARMWTKFRCQEDLRMR